MSELRQSGIDVMGEIPWGVHFCNFYETKQDLIDTLVPYFKAGLENNEFCLWVVPNSELITVEEARRELEINVTGFDHHLVKGNMEILNGLDWYLKENIFNLESVMKAWDAKLKQALALGYDGMRVSGDTSWLTEKDWKDFFAYEKQLNDFVTGLPISVLCTYPLAKSGANEILDVVQAHQFAITRRQGGWEVIETPELIQAKAEIKRLNEELERKVVERTQQLAKAIGELENEIAGRKKTESELKRSELRYRTVIEQASDAIIITDEKGQLIEINNSFCKMFGYTEKELVGMDLASLFDPEYLKTDPLRRDLLLEGKVLFRERRMKKKDGSIFQTEVHVNMLDDKRVLAIVRDITGRKQAEEALRQSEDRIRLIIDTIPIMAWTVRPDGIPDFVNQGWLDYAGVKAMEDPNGIVHPEDLPRVMEKWLIDKAAGKPSEDKMRMRSADGVYRWFLVRTSPLRDEQGNPVKWYGVAIDIEDSKQAEDELRLAYQRLSYHFENTPLAVIELDRDLVIRRWSRHAEEIFGWKASEALGKTVYDPDFPIIYKEDIPAVDKINEELISGVVNRNLSLNRNYTKAGNVIYNEWYNSVLRDEQGNVITILSLVHNVTERKKAEETLQQSYEEIRRLSEHLQNIREEERTNIAREIHDELGQQLTAIKMDVAWIDKNTPDETADIKRKLKNIIALLDGSNQSIRRILSELRSRVLDDHGLLEAIEWLGRQFSEATDIPVKLIFPEKDIKVAEQIATCIFRVCQEAFTNITRYALAKNVSISIKCIEGNIILIIEDDGIGFDTEAPQNKRSFGILGMKERVLSLGGQFELLSSVGKGTKISASLPYQE